MENVNHQLLIIKQKKFIFSAWNIFNAFSSKIVHMENFTLYMFFDVEAYTHTATTNRLKYLYTIYILKYFTQLQNTVIIYLYTF